MTKPINQPLANSIALESKSADKATSEHQAVAEVKSTRSPKGLLDLPPELRLLIYRHLLVPYDLQHLRRVWLPGPELHVNILRTSRLIHREAFAVLYRENNFASVAWYEEALTQQPRVMATIQNVGVEVELDDPVAVELFLKVSRYFGNPSVARGTFTFVCCLEDGDFRDLRWIARELYRLSNFRTLEIYFCDSFCSHDLSPMLDSGYSNELSPILDYFKTALEPALGRAKRTEPRRWEESDLLFHPLDHRDRWREQWGNSWADCLYEIPLEWNQDSESPERGDNKTRGREDKGTRKQRAKETRGAGNGETRELANKGARGRKDGRTRGQRKADDGTRDQRAKKTKGRGDKDKETKTYNPRKRGVHATR